MKIIFIGGGHLAFAIVSTLPKTFEVVVVDRHADKRRRFEQDLQVATAAAVSEAGVQDADVILLAVRPPQMQAVCNSLPPHNAVIISVAAGIRLSLLAAWTGKQKLVRAMPNTPLQVGLGVTAYYAAPSVTVSECQTVENIFSGGGQVVAMSDESLIDVAVAVSGSAPAYVYYLIEAMQEAAVHMGLAEPTAREMVLQVLRGATEMVAHTGKPAAELRAAVAVPGGTTEQAIRVMDSAEFKQTMATAMQAAHDKAVELSAQLAEDKK